MFTNTTKQTSNTLVRSKGAGKHVLICLHGWGKDSTYFDKFIGELDLVNDFKVYLFDWPGFGNAQKLKKPWYLLDYASFLQAVTRDLGLTSYSILAHSFGGGVALKAVYNKLIHPDKLILCGSAGIRKKRRFKKIVFYGLAKIGKILFTLPILNKFSFTAKKILYKLSGSRDYLNAEDKVLRSTLKNVLKEDLSGCLFEIKVPVLLIWGQNDSYTPLSNAYLMRKRLKNSQLKIVPKSGHSLLNVHSALAAEYLRNFVIK